MPSGRTKISPKSVRGLGHVTSTIFGSTVGYPSDSLASCFTCKNRLPYNLYCVGRDVKHCSIQSNSDAEHSWGPGTTTSNV